MNRAGIRRLIPGLDLATGYERASLRPDLMASLSVWAVLVPQSLAYAELAGLSPAIGLYTAFAAMLAYALFGTTRTLNVGPESAVAITIAATVSPLAADDPQRYATLAAILALLVGGFLVIGYLVRAGIVTRLLSSPVLMGYLAGAAIVIVSSQLPKIFGISLEGTTRFEIIELLQRFDEWNWTAFAVGLTSAAAMALIQRFARRLPAALIAITLATLAVVAFDLAERAGVATVGKVRAGLPTLTSFRGVGGDDLLDLLVPAASIALLVYASSVVTARALEARAGRDIAPNREFLGLAAANVGAGLLSGFPANASDSRSFVLTGAGARSQMANVLGAGLVAITLFALTPLVAEIPTAALGGVVLVTAASLIDVDGLRRLWQVRRSDFVLAIVTFAGVVMFDVLAGIVIGVVVSLAETMRRSIAPHRAVLGLVPGELPTYRDIENYTDAETMPGLIVYRFDAPIFFANADAFREEVLRLVREAEVPVREFVVSAEAVYDIDTTGIEMLEHLLNDLDRLNVRLLFARVRTDVRDLMTRTGLEERIGDDSFFLTVMEAGRAFASRYGTEPPEGR